MPDARPRRYGILLFRFSNFSGRDLAFSGRAILGTLRQVWVAEPNRQISKQATPRPITGSITPKFRCPRPRM